MEVGPIGIGTMREVAIFVGSKVAQLVRLIVMAEFEDGGASHVADSGRRFNIGRMVVRIVSQLAHQRLVDGLGVPWKKIGKRAVGGIADGTFLIGFGAFVGRPAKRTAQLRANSLLIVSSPGVVRAIVEDGQR